MTPEQRSRCMSKIRGKNTRPELYVRKYLFSKGLRFRIHVKKLPGTPDIVLPKYRTVIFVNGCFWHGHQNCGSLRMPKSNEQFWKQKIELNMARDYRWSVELRLLGWRVITVWECQLTKQNRLTTLEALYREITRKHEPVSPTAEPGKISAKTNAYGYSESEISMAAEDGSTYNTNHEDS